MPIANALVRGQLTGGGQFYDTVETYSAADGTYTLYGRAGDWQVYVYDNTDYKTRTQSLAGLTTPRSIFLSGVTATGATLDIVYYRAAVITGTLTKSDTGAAVADASFSISGDRYFSGSSNSLGEIRGWAYASRYDGSIDASVYWNTSIPGYARPSPIYDLTPTRADGHARPVAHAVHPVLGHVQRHSRRLVRRVPVAGATIHVARIRATASRGGTDASGHWSVLGPGGDGYVYGNSLTGYGQSNYSYFYGATGSVDTGTLIFPTAFINWTIADDQSPAVPLAGVVVDFQL